MYTVFNWCSNFGFSHIPPISYGLFASKIHNSGDSSTHAKSLIFEEKLELVVWWKACSGK